MINLFYNHMSFSEYMRGKKKAHQKRFSEHTKVQREIVQLRNEILPSLNKGQIKSITYYQEEFDKMQKIMKSEILTRANKLYDTAVDRIQLKYMMKQRDKLLEFKAYLTKDK